MKIISIIGTRPQFIKLFPICRAIRQFNQKYGSLINHKIINTGQHFDNEMSQIFIEELGIDKPDYDLGVVEKSPCMQISKMLPGLEKILLEEKPLAVIVYGDTNSTLAGALSAKKLNFTLAHIEAGLRSYNRDMPEEVNRILVDKISDFLFCPTKNSFTNLKKEGYLEKNQKYMVFNVGDVMYDSFKFFKGLAIKKSHVLDEIFNKNSIPRYIIVTIHRAENTDNITRLKEIFDFLIKVSQKIKIIFPIHPRTRLKLSEIEGFIYNAENLIIVKPVSYFDMIALEKNANLILTDSGGVQKEAYFIEKKCITLRNETEWVETLKDGCNVLTSMDYDKITSIIDDKEKSCSFRKNIFGNGKASQLIINILAEHLMQ